MKQVIVTRHPALVEYLVQTGVCPEGTPVITHGTAENLTGKHAIGVLPLHLAAVAAMVTEIPMAIPPELRGVELDLEQTKKYAGQPVTYKVSKIEQ